jgi:hypothetical protein
MKIVILLTVIESFAVMLAIMYLYYISWIVGGAALLSTSKLNERRTLSFRRANGET